MSTSSTLLSEGVIEITRAAALAEYTFGILDICNKIGKYLPFIDHYILEKQTKWSFKVNYNALTSKIRHALNLCNAEKKIIDSIINKNIKICGEFMYHILRNTDNYFLYEDIVRPNLNTMDLFNITSRMHRSDSENMPRGPIHQETVMPDQYAENNNEKLISNRGSHIYSTRDPGIMRYTVNYKTKNRIFYYYTEIRISPSVKIPTYLSRNNSIFFSRKTYQVISKQAGMDVRNIYIGEESSTIKNIFDMYPSVLARIAYEPSSGDLKICSPTDIQKNIYRCRIPTVSKSLLNWRHILLREIEQILYYADYYSRYDCRIDVSKPMEDYKQLKANRGSAQKIIWNILNEYHKQVYITKHYILFVVNINYDDYIYNYHEIILNQIDGYFIDVRSVTIPLTEDPDASIRCGIRYYDVTSFDIESEEEIFKIPCNNLYCNNDSVSFVYIWLSVNVEML